MLAVILREDSTSDSGRTAQGEYERVVEDTTYTGSYDLSASSITDQSSNTALLLEDNVWQLVWPNAPQSDATAERSPTLDTSSKNQRVTTGNNSYRFEYWANGIVSPNEELETEWTGVASESGSIRYDTTMHMSGAVLLTPPSEQEPEQNNAPESNDDFFADPNAVADLPDSVWPSALRSGTTTQNELLAFVNMRNVFKALDGDVSGSVHVNVQYNYDKAKAIDQALADGDWNAIAGSIATDDVLDVDVIVNGSKVLDEGELTGTLHFGQVTQIDKITDRDDTWDANAQLWNSVGTKSEQTISNGSSNVILHGSQPGSAGKASVIMQIDISNVTGNNSGEGKTEELKLKPSAAQPSLQALPGMSSSQTLLGFPDTGLDRFDWQQTAGGSGKASSSLMTYTAQGSGTYQGDDMSGSGTVSNTVTTATSTAQANIFLPTTGGSNSTSTRSVSTSVNNVITSQGQGFYTYDVGGGSVSGTKLESTLNNVVIDRWEVTSTPVSGSTTASTQSERQAIVNSLKLIPIIGQSSNEPTWQDAIEAAITTATGGESSLSVQSNDNSSFSGFGTFTAALNGSGSGSIAENGSNSLTSNFNTASAVDSAGAWQLVSGNQDVRTASNNAYTQTFAGNWSTNDGIYNMQGTTDWLKSNDSQNSDSTFRQLVDGDWQSTRTSSYSTSSTDNDNQRGSGTYQETSGKYHRQGTASVSNENSSSSNQSLTRLYRDGVQIDVFGSGSDQNFSSKKWQMDGTGDLYDQNSYVIEPRTVGDNIVSGSGSTSVQLDVIESSSTDRTVLSATSYAVVGGSLQVQQRSSQIDATSEVSSTTKETRTSKRVDDSEHTATGEKSHFDSEETIITKNRRAIHSVRGSKNLVPGSGSGLEPLEQTYGGSVQSSSGDSKTNYKANSVRDIVDGVKADGKPNKAKEKITYVSEIITFDTLRLENDAKSGESNAADNKNKTKHKANGNRSGHETRNEDIVGGERERKIEYGSFDRDIDFSDNRSSYNKDTQTDDNSSQVPADYTNPQDTTPFTADVTPAGGLSPQGYGPKFDSQAQPLGAGQTDGSNPSQERFASEQQRHAARAADLLEMRNELVRRLGEGGVDPASREYFNVLYDFDMLADKSNFGGIDALVAKALGNIATGNLPLLNPDGSVYTGHVNTNGVLGWLSGYSGDYTENTLIIGGKLSMIAGITALTIVTAPASLGSSVIIGAGIVAYEIDQLQTQVRSIWTGGKVDSLGATAIRNYSEAAGLERNGTVANRSSMVYDNLNLIAAVRLCRNLVSGVYKLAPIGGAFKGGQLFEKVFDTSQGKVGFLSETIINGKTLHLKDIVIEPVKTGVLKVGIKEVSALKEQLITQTRAAGFDKLILTGERLTGANPGKIVELIIDLTK